MQRFWAEMAEGRKQELMNPLISEFPRTSSSCVLPGIYQEKTNSYHKWLNTHVGCGVCTHALCVLKRRRAPVCEWDVYYLPMWIHISECFWRCLCTPTSSRRLWCGWSLNDFLLCLCVLGVTLRFLHELLTLCSTRRSCWDGLHAVAASHSWHWVWMQPPELANQGNSKPLCSLFLCFSFVQFVLIFSKPKPTNDRIRKTTQSCEPFYAGDVHGRHVHHTRSLNYRALWPFFSVAIIPTDSGVDWSSVCTVSRDGPVSHDVPAHAWTPWLPFWASNCGSQTGTCDATSSRLHVLGKMYLFFPLLQVPTSTLSKITDWHLDISQNDTPPLNISPLGQLKYVTIGLPGICWLPVFPFWLQ